MDVEVLDWLWKAGRHDQHVEDFLAFRQIIEPTAARMATLRATAEQRGWILSLYTALEASNTVLEGSAGASVAPVWPVAVEADLQFHGAIYESSGNEMLGDIGRLIVHMIRKQIATTTAAPGTFAIGILFHRRSAESVDTGDAAAYQASNEIVLSAFDTAAQSRAIKAKGGKRKRSKNAGGLQ